MFVYHDAEQEIYVRNWSASHSILFLYDFIIMIFYLWRRESENRSSENRNVTMEHPNIYVNYEYRDVLPFRSLDLI